MKFGLSFGFQYFWLFGIFFLMAIQLHFSIDSASQLFTVGKSLMCVTVTDRNIVQDRPEAGQLLENIAGEPSA